MDDCPLKPLTLHSIRPPINYENSTNASLAFITIQAELQHLCSREENQCMAWATVVFDSLMLPDLGFFFFPRASASGTVWTLDGSCVALWRAAWLLLHVPNVCASQTTFRKSSFESVHLKGHFQVFPNDFNLEIFTGTGTWLYIGLNNPNPEGDLLISKRHWSWHMGARVLHRDAGSSPNWTPPLSSVIAFHSQL